LNANLQGNGKMAIYASYSTPVFFMYGLKWLILETPRPFGTNLRDIVHGNMSIRKDSNSHRTTDKHDPFGFPFSKHINSV
jgi:hypothetical protein